MAKYQYETVKVDINNLVAHVQLNRAKKLNAFNDAMVRDVRLVFEDLAGDKNIRVVVLSGSGRMLTAGLDLTESTLLKSTDEETGEELDCARKSYNTRAHIENFQQAFTAIEKCDKPVIAAIHSGCYGAGVDMVTACDMRYCTKDALFCVKEVDVGLAADVGTLQRLPKVIGNQSLVRELCFSGRNMYAAEAHQAGLVNRVFDTFDEMMAEAMNMANLIASKSPVAVVGTKHNLIYSRDHSVAESLAYQVTWSSAMLNTDDIPKSFVAFVSKEPAKYSKL
ncbi:ClpP/crotonase [Hesseltinella vesiculosa]|uniref:ClpP/crotonase n=1 Tax=Hesseltinella vesiculosa TaxID=101127 RepID=A0A1X2GWQ0_9FUNG|nr:ClpP/crotonase [Hesseltinella vesiculosa]